MLYLTLSLFFFSDSWSVNVNVKSRQAVFGASQEKDFGGPYEKHKCGKFYWISLPLVKVTMMIKINMLTY